jgi:hypothetical protein
MEVSLQQSEKFNKGL